MALETVQQRLLEAAIGYFGSREAANQWLDTPHMGIGGTCPRDLLRTLEGSQQLEELIGQLEQGDSP